VLNMKKKLINYMYESGNYTREEIAEKFGITPKRVYQIVTQGEEVKNFNSSSNLSNELTKDDEDVNIETYPGPPIPKPINDSDDDDFDDFDDLDDEDEEEEDDRPIVLTANPDVIAKKMAERVEAFLDTIATPENIDMIVNYFHKEHSPAYSQLLAERLRMSIRIIHELIGKLIERR